jgi:serine/threonine protein kinase
MSPEQAIGDRQIDARTDIYSLGALSYEMLAGEPPHSGTTAQAIIAKLMTEDPRPIMALRRSVPLHVEATVQRALQKLPADRFATAQEFADALRGKTVLTSVPTRADTRSFGRWRISADRVGGGRDERSGVGTVTRANGTGTDAARRIYARSSRQRGARCLDGLGFI